MAPHASNLPVQKFSKGLSAFDGECLKHMALEIFATILESAIGRTPSPQVTTNIATLSGISDPLG